MPAIADHAWDEVEITRTAKKLTIQSASWHCLAEPLRGIQPVAFAGDELSPGPQDPPAIEFLRHEPAFTGLPLVIAEELQFKRHVYGQTLPGQAGGINYKNRPGFDSPPKA